MKILKRMRSGLKASSVPEALVYEAHHSIPIIYHQSAAEWLPVGVLERLFTFVCPHVGDESYKTCEDSALEDSCMLCDMRDLAHCVPVCRAWAEAAKNMLYCSIRLDSVHYCEREVVLAERRRQRSFSRNGEPKDVPQQRLQLLYHTLRTNARLAARVQILKMPYMMRETCTSDLARIVSVLPNLRYVDLPESFFSNDAQEATLRLELQNRCPNIRKMKYAAGAEASFTTLVHTRQWQHLEVLELSRLHVEPESLLYVLVSFPALHQVSLHQLTLLEDSILAAKPMLPPFPPLYSLEFSHTPNITAQGLVAYLSRPETRQSLRALTLIQTGVVVPTVHSVLATAPHLETLRISEVVGRSFPLTPVPPLRSRSLRTLHFEILPSSTASPAAIFPCDTYYTYLAKSLLSGCLPSLTALYAFSPVLPDLLLAPPNVPFTPSSVPRMSAYSGRSVSASPSISLLSTTTTLGRQPLPATSGAAGLAAPLRLYTKPSEAPELEWCLTCIEPPSDSNGRRGSVLATRPISLARGRTRQLSADNVPERGSMLVGNGFGGFLTVPATEDGRPRSTNRLHRPSVLRFTRGTSDPAWMG